MTFTPIYLRTERERQELTQEQLAAKSGVKQNAISKLETGHSQSATADTLLLLAAALNVDPRALRFGPDPEEGRGLVARAAAAFGNRRRTPTRRHDMRRRSNRVHDDGRRKAARR